MIFSADWLIKSLKKLERWKYIWFKYPLGLFSIRIKQGSAIKKPISILWSTKWCNLSLKQTWSIRPGKLYASIRFSPAIVDGKPASQYPSSPKSLVLSGQPGWIVISLFKLVIIGISASVLARVILSIATIAIYPQVPVQMPITQLHSALAPDPRVDTSKPLAAFERKISEYIVAWFLAMCWYFVVNENLSDNQKATRIALNLGRTAQKWFQYVIDIPPEYLTLVEIIFRPLSSCNVPN